MFIHTAYDDYNLDMSEEELEDNDRRQAEWIAEQAFLDAMYEQDSLFASMPMEEETN